MFTKRDRSINFVESSRCFCCMGFILFILSLKCIITYARAPSDVQVINTLPNLFYSMFRLPLYYRSRFLYLGRENGMIVKVCPWFTCIGVLSADRAVKPTISLKYMVTQS